MIDTTPAAWDAECHEAGCTERAHRCNGWRLGRIRELADAIDRNVGSRPELAASQVGFAAGLIVNAIKSDPVAALDQLDHIGGLLAKALAWVDRGEAPTDSDLLAGLG